MRSWISFPVGNGVRVGLAGPVVTRRLTYWDMVSAEGRRAWGIYALLFAAVSVSWIALSDAPASETLTRIFLYGLPITWIVSWAIRSLFPLWLEEESAQKHNVQESTVYVVSATKCSRCHQPFKDGDVVIGKPPSHQTCPPKAASSPDRTSPPPPAS